MTLLMTVSKSRVLFDILEIQYLYGVVNKSIGAGSEGHSKKPRLNLIKLYKV